LKFIDIDRARRLRPWNEDFRDTIYGRSSASRVRERVTPIGHAYSRTQRLLTRFGRGPRRELFPALLAAGAARRGAAGAGFAPVRLKLLGSVSSPFRHPREDRLIEEISPTGA